MSRTNALTVLILAAGKGVRMGTSVPKVLHKVCGKTLIARTIEAAALLCPKNIVVVLGAGVELVQAELQNVRSRVKVPIEEVIQSEQHGTGHAVQVAFSSGCELADEILILPGDIPLLSASSLEFPKNSALSFLSGFPSTPYGFGRVVRSGEAGEEGRVLGIVEHKDCTEEQLRIGEINSGIYRAEKKFLASALKTLKKNNSQGEYYLTDIVSSAVEEGELVEGFAVKNFSEIAGANSIAELHELERTRRLELIQQFMAQGVTFEDCNAVYIEENVQIEPDCFIGAGVRLLGNTKISQGARIEGGCFISNGVVHRSAHLKPYCVVTDSEVGTCAVVGPFAHLRPQTILGENSKIGNFVETKKSSIAAGAKVNHLSYIGDSQVGERANVGAGTITCNYDGRKKSATIIEQGAFIGSNTSLVAPVRIGANAVVGAGSVITRDVPEDALAVERSEQIIVPSWSKKKPRK